ncbi:MAG: hypothetical protein SFU85_04430 [Candidatus Methylacidiphilales bacterium]|nr:hypothetical protein [Candidatus Methylacidiphilales bacterium]
MKDWLEGLIGLVYPALPVEGEPRPVEEPFCQRCGEPFPMTPTGAFDCTNCRGQTWAISRARAGYLSEGPVREAVHGFKYRGEFHRLRQLAGWMEEGYRRFYADEAGGWDGLVPVPLHPEREREREFNQAHELARQLGRRTGLPVFPGLGAHQGHLEPGPAQAQ